MSKPQSGKVRRVKKRRRGYPFDVVGLRHRLEQTEIDMLVEATEGKQMKAKLEREPTNEVDPNAIKVLVYVSRLKTWRHIGYLRKEAASVFAQALDRGTSEVKSCKLVHVNADHGWGRVRVVLENAVDKPEIYP